MLPVIDRHIRPGAGQFQGASPTNAAGGSGDEGFPAIEDRFPPRKYLLKPEGIKLGIPQDEPQANRLSGEPRQVRILAP